MLEPGYVGTRQSNPGYVYYVVLNSRKPNTAETLGISSLAPVKKPMDLVYLLAIFYSSANLR